MNLKEVILKEHSKRQAMKIIHWVGHDKKRFEKLIALFLKGEYPVTQRAGWPLSYCAIEHPYLVKPYLNMLIRNLENKGLHDAVKRNTVRLLQEIEIPEKLQGLTAKICFSYLASRKEAVAVKCFSMTVLANLCKQHPELTNELKMIVEEQLPYSTAGFKSRAKRTFTTLDKIDKTANKEDKKITKF